MPSLLAPISRRAHHVALACLALVSFTSLSPAQAGAQVTASVQVFARVVERPTTNAVRTGATAVRPVSGGVVVTQQMSLESSVDSQTLEAEFTPADAEALVADSRPVSVFVRCGGHAGRCRLSGGATPRIAIEVEVLGLSQSEVARAVAAPERFATALHYRIVRGEGV